MQSVFHPQPPPPEPLRSAWAKSPRAYGGESTEMLPLYVHLDDTASVADAMWDTWLSPATRHSVAKSLGTELLARKTAVFLAAGHDIGKHSSAFAMQVETLAQRMRTAGASFLPLSAMDRRGAPHSVISYLSLLQWFEAKTGVWGNPGAKALAGVVGGHHGIYPDETRLPTTVSAYANESHLHWNGDRMSWWNRAAATAGLSDPELETLAFCTPTQSALHVLTGFIIVCDWIASNADLFPLASVTDRKARTERALRALALPGPWSPEDVRDTEELFASRFNLPRGSTPRTTQLAAMKAATDMETPGLILVEAPTGEGKTEAALAAAEIVASRFGYGGAVVALPTCATSDGIFPRILDWLTRAVPDGEETSAVLCHSRAQFNDEYRGLMEGRDRLHPIYDDAEDTGHGDGCSRISAHWWLRGRKKAALADFSVGTIDQVLFAALASKHVMLRHLGLSGKVVILDEVHSADTYMAVYLDRVLEWLAAAGTTVIALSATLSPARRAEMCTAYARGQRSSVPAVTRSMSFAERRARRRKPKSDPEAAIRKQASEVTGYPAISTVSGGSLSVLTPPPSGRTRTFTIRSTGESPASIAREALDMTRSGGCVGIVANTVSRAQEIFRSLSGALPEEEVFLLHSRFLAVDRREREKKLLHLLGPGGERPNRLIVVATQVIEQSLDIDFDALISDLAPLDLLIQRAGRMHRHARNNNGRPANLRSATLHISGVTGVDFGSSELPGEPPVFPVGSVRVYGAASLLRTVITLLRHGPVITSPDHVSGLVDAAYSRSLDVPDSWREAWTSAHDKEDQEHRDSRERAGTFLVAPPTRGDTIGWATVSDEEPGDRKRGVPQVRDADSTYEVIVIQEQDGNLISLPWIGEHGGRVVNAIAGVDDELARSIATCTVTLPAFLSKGKLGDDVLVTLEDNYIDVWQKSHWLKGQLPLILDENLTTHINQYKIWYDMKTGIEIKNTVPEKKENDDTMSRSSFNLIDEPWIKVLDNAGKVEEVGIRKLFRSAGEYRQLSSELPTTDFAILRTLLAILYRAFREELQQGPLDYWKQMWDLKSLDIELVDEYLDTWYQRFDLCDPAHPFLQAPDLRTTSGNWKDLSVIIPDSPGEGALFTRSDPTSPISLAEGARWLIHTNSWDYSGIKSGQCDDPRVKGGRGYPMGTGWCGWLGGTTVVGGTLLETLLLNLIADHAPEAEDLPLWEEPPLPSGPRSNVRPPGQVALFTWPQRRIRLHVENGLVTGALVCNGDPVAYTEQLQNETMTAFRYSEPQSKKAKRTIYMPRTLNRGQTMWRGLETLLPHPNPGMVVGLNKTKVRRFIPPRNVAWVGKLANGILPPAYRIVLDVVSIEYGSKSSVIDTILHDSLRLSSELASADAQNLQGLVLSAVERATQIGREYTNLAGNLAVAAGGSPDGQRAHASARYFSQVDPMFRTWLTGITGQCDPTVEGTAWASSLRKLALGLAEDLVVNAGENAWTGREHDGHVYTAPLAHARFIAAVNKILPHEKPGTAAPPPDETPTEDNT
ncbi:CRISPR-associated helicase Cas3' [Corynebacterium pygosceleis]|uniref:CRISPR-associated helicase Cas3 n=2 Tax=Corynebacterium pygosceleis TaxID=2800406 RepID=A0A9Q4C9G7_9CORY|nr:CRISPR-associated helicase Cas3' [Corynebacterium pygosceleis]MCX7469346.1 CRISPR-associated helicase Cas3' [Corynebacterium pygosceleis]